MRKVRKVQHDREITVVNEAGVFYLKNNQILHIADFSGCLVCLMGDYNKPKGVFYYKGEPGQEFVNQLARFIDDFKELNFVKDIRTTHVKFISTGFYLSSIEEQFNELKVEYKGKIIQVGEDYEVLFYVDINKLRLAKVLHDDVTSEEKVKVLVVDDSATIRKILKNLIEVDDKFTIIGEAADAKEAQHLIDIEKPDVITLDINMPEKTGVEFLKEYFPKYKIPTIMVTSVNISDGSSVLEAFENGAIDYIQKPSMESLESLGAVLREKVLVASNSNPSLGLRESYVKKRKPKKYKPANTQFTFHEGGLLAIGASTGGTEAIKKILLGLPDNIPPILISQHIPAYFSKAFAVRLNEFCNFTVKEAEHDELVLPGVAYVAPGGTHMTVVEKAGHRLVNLITEGVDRHSPSVDRLFNSVAELSVPSVGVILTGMGSDGAKGLLKMKESGCYTISQDKSSSVVWGMPKVAYEIGASMAVLGILDISEELCAKLRILNKNAS